MRFAMLCYDAESTRWDKAEDDAIMARHTASNQALAAKKKLGPHLRLMDTAGAVTVRSGNQPLVLDGPFAETKEQLLGLWILDCESLEEAIEIARDFASHKKTGALELRPLMTYAPGDLGK